MKHFERFLLFTLLLLFSTNTYAQYADLGTGALKDQIWWFDWNNFQIKEGAIKSFTTDDGLKITIQFKNIVGDVPYGNVMNTWSGAVLHYLYDFSNTDIQPALYTGIIKKNTSLSIEIRASRNGIPVPFTFIAADAEASDINERIVLQTNGFPWQTVDFFRNSTQTSNPLSGCNTKNLTITDTYGGSAGSGQNPVVASEGSTQQPMTVSVSFNRTVQGGSAIAIGIIEAVDRGDLPASYGYAQHALSYTNTNSCNYLTPLPKRVQSSAITLGAIAGDADATQTVDDNTNGKDEDAVSNFNLYDGSGNYSIEVGLRNTTLKNAFLTGWFDYNRNGVFENAESVSEIVPPNILTARLTWKNLPTLLPQGSVSDFAFRLRLSSDINAVQLPTGFALDGEIEDYLVKIENPPVVVPSFTLPDTVCVNTPVHITNTTTGASNYYWSFCTADLKNTIPSGDNLGNVNGVLSQPVFTELVAENGKYYAFLTNHYPGGLVRLDFGNSYLNTPVATSYGNFGGIIPSGYGTEGIQVVKNEGKWYVIIVAGSPPNNVPSRLIKVELGTNIENSSPVATNWGNIGNESMPIDFYMFKDKNQWYGFTVNAYNNTITRIAFTNSFDNTPTGTNLGNVGNMLNYPTGVHAVNNEGNWNLFVTNTNSNKLVRLDFGNSLLNTPTAKDLGSLNNTLNAPRDITIIQSCESTIGYVVNGIGNDIVQLDFNNDFNSIPTGKSLGNIGKFSFPHSISKLFRVNNDLYSFITNVNNNTITRLKFAGCTNSNIAGSSMQKPPDVVYNKPGTYNITLSVDEGLATQTSTCRQVVVIAPPTPHPTIDTVFCEGGNVNLVSLANGSNYSWNTGATTSIINVTDAGTYWVTTDSYGCKSTDSFYVSKAASPVVSLGKDTGICKGDSLTLFAKNTGNTYLWQDGSTTDSLKITKAGVYSVAVTNMNGCINKDTININAFSSPVLLGLEDKTICENDVAQLSVNAAGTNNYFAWQPDTTLSALDISNPIAKPLDTTKYYISVKNGVGCTTRDSVTVNVVSRPSVTVRADTSVCKGEPVTLSAIAANATVFSWSPSNDLSNGAILSPVARAITTTTYSITAGNGICNTTDEVTIKVKQLPLIIASNDTSICGSANAQLTATGGVAYIWLPATGLNSADIQNPIASPAQTVVYHVKGMGDNGCENEDSVKVTVAAKPEFAINPTNSKVCLGDSILVTSSGGNFYEWDATPAILQPHQATTYIKPSANGVYKVIVTNSTCNETDTLYTTLTIAEKPVVHVNYSNAVDCSSNTATLTATGASSYLWSPVATLMHPNSASPIAMPTETTTYHVKATGTNGCVAEDSVTVEVVMGNSDNAYQMASAFTPNNDGINDCFGVKKWSIVKSLDLSIYNRWGTSIFHSNNVANCWDGTYKGIPQSTGAYIYIIKAETLCGNINRKGTVVLIR